jgi:hypothetical protein
MQRSSPESYRGLWYSDYPTKNGKQVNALVHLHATSKLVKDEMVEQVYERLEPKIDSRTEDMNPISRCLAKRAVIGLIKVAIDRAVDSVVFNEDNPPTTAPPTSSNQ